MDIEGDIMKKVITVIMLFFLSLSIVACHEEKTYDDLYLEYLTHIENNELNYQSSIDYFNHLSQEVIKSVVLVEKIVQTSSESSTGSGVLFKSDANYYYILTNNHVIYSEIVSDSTIYTISDFQGNEYDAELIEQSGDYDLAILRIERGPLDLPIIEFAPSNPLVYEKMAVLGYPGYQINAISLGNVVDYAFIEVESTSFDVINVLFDVLISDVPVKSGSSGSVSVNDQFQLVGIVYAGNFKDTSTTSEYTFSIPVEKVLEFFQLKQFSLEDNS